MKHLVLVGFMGSGKSAVGRRVSADLGLPFIDTDALIEAEAGCAIRALFEEEGESGFRDRESRHVAEAASGPVSVVATGGGAMIRPENVAALRRNGILIHLAIDAPTVLKRAGSRVDRPLLAGCDDPLARIEALMDAREAIYAQADASVPTVDASIEEAAAGAIREWRRLGGDDRSREKRS